jgi:hypothetical protein
VRTQADLALAARSAGLHLDQVEPIVLADGSTELASRMSFSDPWAAARLLQILADEDASDPVVRSWSLAILDAVAEDLGEDASGPTLSPELVDAYARALHANVQQQIRFIHEPKETFQSARVTLALRAGDCDDHARLLYAAALAGGLPAQLLFNDEDDQPVHVVTKLRDSSGWQWAETTLGAQFGEEPFDALDRLVALDPQHNPLSRGPMASGIGTVLGNPSLAELRDLLRTKDYEIDALGQAWGDLSPTWIQKDPTAYVAWTNDFDALKTRYLAAREHAELVLGLSSLNPLNFLPEKAQAAGSAWDEVLAAVSPVPNTVSPGSLHDLYNRLEAAGGQVDLSHYPALTPGNDLDMEVLSTLNRVPAILGGGNTSGFFGSGIPTWLVLSGAGLGALVLLAPTLAEALSLRGLRRGRA